MADRPTTVEQVAQYALNGWAIYATRKIEHDDIALLWSELKALSERSEPAEASVPPGGELHVLLAQAWWKGRQSINAHPPAEANAPKLIALCENDIRALSSAPGERT
jgi:hypothetical protein